MGKEDRNQMVEEFNAKLCNAKIYLTKAEEKYKADLNHVNKELVTATKRTGKLELELKERSDSIIKLREALSNSKIKLTKADEKLVAALERAKKAESELQIKNKSLTHNEAVLVRTKLDL